MKNNDLFLIEGRIFRVLSSTNTEALIINCLEKKMPYWENMETVAMYEQVSEDKLFEISNITFPDYKTISPDKIKLIQEKYGTISFVIPHIKSEAERNSAIEICSTKFGLSKATIRNRLCSYLAFQDIRIFLPTVKKSDIPLSADKKNFRWALNKYYYTAIKIPLKEAYRRMLKERYCDEYGKLLPSVPSFRQFSYFYQKTNTKEKQIITRDGKGSFLRNDRVMLGNGIRDFCPTIGYGMFDSTICDIFLVNDKGDLLGRPILTACVDGYSSMCLGYYLGFSGGVHSLTALLQNIITDKKEHCNKFGISIDKEDWYCSMLPHKFITDKGKEYVSKTFSQVTDLGIEIINLPPYRPDLKSAIEKFFDIVQGYYKKDLASRGVIFEDYQERGGKDYRKNATFTLKEFEKILLLCIIRYNTKRIIDLPYEYIEKIQPFSNLLWNTCLPNHKNNLISTTKEQLELILLPRTEGTFKRNGLNVNGLRYKNMGYTEKFLTGGKATVAYDPNNVSKVWLIEKGTYIEFDIIESFFEDMDLCSVQSLKMKKNDTKRMAEDIALQGSIDLSRALENISKSKVPSNPSIENVRENRKIEIIKDEYDG